MRLSDEILDHILNTTLSVSSTPLHCSGEREAHRGRPCRTKKGVGLDGLGDTSWRAAHLPRNTRAYWSVTQKNRDSFVNGGIAH